MRIGNKRYWQFQLFGWGVFILVHLFFTFTFGRMGTDADQRLFIGRIGFFVLLGIVFTHLMRLVIIRINLLQKKLEKQALIFLAITLIFSVIAAVFYIQLLSGFGFLAQKERESIKDNGFFLVVLSNAFNIFIFYFIWNLIYFMYHYIAKSQKQQLDTLQLESMVKELELKTIKAHINPHFIFNSLNSIRALVDENPERARTAITELSSILRSSMKADKAESVALEKELGIIRDYLALENMRFEDRLKVDYAIESETLPLPVPPMMLQTLVENAIKHGISKQIQGGVVKIISELKNGFHHLSVQNTGYLSGHSGSDGFGLFSTTNRLSLMYGNKAKFEIKQLTPTMVEANVLIPVETVV